MFGDKKKRKKKKKAVNGRRKKGHRRAHEIVDRAFELTWVRARQPNRSIIRAQPPDRSWDAKSLTVVLIAMPRRNLAMAVIRRPGL
jgi:hypothetical protein